MSAVNAWDFLVSSVVEGTFPDYDPLVETQELNGYQSQQYECSVVSRCRFGTHNCNFDADIAMLYCPSRASNAAWLPIAPSDPNTGNVEMY